MITINPKLGIKAHSLGDEPWISGCNAMSKNTTVNTTPKLLDDPGLIFIDDFSLTTLYNQIILIEIKDYVIAQSKPLWQMYVSV